MNILLLKFHRQNCMEGSRVNPGAFIFYSILATHHEVMIS